jgi:hypothetical protein
MSFERSRGDTAFQDSRQTTIACGNVEDCLSRD